MESSKMPLSSFVSQGDFEGNWTSICWKLHIGDGFWVGDEDVCLVLLSALGLQRVQFMQALCMLPRSLYVHGSCWFRGLCFHGVLHFLSVYVLNCQAISPVHMKNTFFCIYIYILIDLKQCTFPYFICKTYESMYDSHLKLLLKRNNRAYELWVM